MVISNATPLLRHCQIKTHLRKVGCAPLFVVFNPCPAVGQVFPHELHTLCKWSFGALHEHCNGQSQCFYLGLCFLHPFSCFHFPSKLKDEWIILAQAVEKQKPPVRIVDDEPKLGCLCKSLFVSIRERIQKA